MVTLACGLALTACAHVPPGDAASAAPGPLAYPKHNTLPVPTYDRARREAFADRVDTVMAEVADQKRESLARWLRHEADPEAPMIALTVGSDDPALLFVVGNHLFERIPELSVELHRRALALDPGNPLVSYQLGLHAHRRGRCDEAMPYYRRYLVDGSGPGIVPGLMAHCAMVLGDVAGAVAYFDQFAYRRHRVELENAFASMFVPDEPWSRRARLASDGRAGDSDAYLELIVLDMSILVVSPLSPRNDSALLQDLPVVRQALRGDAERLAVLEFIVGEWSDPLDRARAVAHRFPDRLPESHYAASIVLVLRRDRSFDDRAALVAYGDDLRRRFEADDPVGNSTYPSLLAGAGSNDLLAEVDRTACVRGSVPSCVRRVIRGDSDGRDEFAGDPNDVLMPSARLLHALCEGHPLREADLISYIRTGPYAMTSSRGWKLAFITLASQRDGRTVSEALPVWLMEALWEELRGPAHIREEWCPSLRADQPGR